MQGALLSTGRTEDYIALGDTGQPVHKAALQIIAALSRKSPDLASFLAVPKSNEQGSVIDWYSPVLGEVVSWSALSEIDRADARQKFQAFKAGIASMSSALVTSSTKTNQSDTVIFGKLLGLASHSPDDSCIKIIKSQRVTADGVTESYNQPVLTFWGFILNEEDRKRAPLYFLDPPPAAPAVPATAAPPAISSTPRITPAPQPTTVLERKRPWWLFWSGWRFGFGWLWPLLLLLLLLLLLSLLRGCIPGISQPSFGAPSIGSPDVGLPSTAPADSPSVTPTDLTADSGTQKSEVVPTMPNPVQQGETKLPLTDKSAEAPLAPEVLIPPTHSREALAQQSAETGSIPAQPNQATDRASQPQPLGIPPATTEGAADFLDGRYRAGSGIQDRRTGKPLRLEYAFEKGKGKVTVQRPDGIVCTGGVIASMNGGNLAINSQGQAACSDGSQYDMPEVNCKPGAESIADCTGKYGNDTFPMSMRKADK